MGISSPGDIGKDMSNGSYNTDTPGAMHGGAGPIDTVGDVGMDEKNFSKDTSQHNPTKRAVPTGNPITSPGNVNKDNQ